jgi:1-deoxy-D-xylulose-5-phosphate reductoisomerase
MKKKLVILGSTGNLGVQTLEVLSRYRESFQVVGLSAHQNADLLAKQKTKIERRQAGTPVQTALTSIDGPGALVRLATHPDADIVINVLSGLSGIEPSIAALKANKILLTANKESIVTEGEKIMALAKLDQLIPLDSEHNAIYEILKHLSPGTKPVKIILPCSGGPFHQLTEEELASKTIADALKHPRWNMGAKISLESALLINKGLEIIEAHHLFNFPIDKIDVRIHPECQIHGMVETQSGETYAYTSEPDMKEHIENALLRTLTGSPRGDFSNRPEKIRPISPNEIPQIRPNHALLPGIEIVKQHHANKTLKEFLLHEEEIIQKALASAPKTTMLSRLVLALQTDKPL